MTKVNDEQFWQCLTENAGIFKRTAEKLSEQYDISITRQSVRERALKDEDKLEMAREECVDVAEETLIGHMKQKKDRRISLDATKIVLNAKARHLGYGNRLDVTTKDRPLQAPAILFGDVDDRDLEEESKEEEK